jgi:poly(A) polymerase
MHGVHSIDMNSTADSKTTSVARREFAMVVVQKLRRARHQALWAGGCVRDALLGMIPKDYDVATSATPEEVIDLFGKRHTVPIGISFGVVMVLGPTRAASQVEVATFRSDGEYSDGRRPDSVRYCSAEEDARRRDFTINGMFFDPVGETLIDYVGGEKDLRDGIVRAIGDPDARFDEDKLRMLRAVRFAATLGFSLDVATEQSVLQRHDLLTAVSIERITAELRRMLSHSSRAQAVTMLDQTGLLAVVFPVAVDASAGTPNETGWDTLTSLAVLNHLQVDRCEPALLSLLSRGRFDADDAVSRLRRECHRLKLSNRERDCICWLQASLSVLNNIAEKPLHVIKPLLAHPDRELLLDLSAAIAAAHGSHPTDTNFCRQFLGRCSHQQLDPAPLISGRDVLASGIPAGAQVRQLLEIIRREQLDDKLTDRESALLRLRELVRSAKTSP